MMPLIKWAGGKSNELKYIESMIPSYENYFEPFFGGGALFFNLEPKCAYLNDISPDLISFYKLLKEKNGRREKFRKELCAYVRNWSEIDRYLRRFGNSFLEIYDEYRRKRISDAQFTKKVTELFEKKILLFNGQFSDEFAIKREDLRLSIQKSVISRLTRVRDVIDTENGFPDTEVMKNVETAFRSGFYLHFRSVMNEAISGRLQLSKERRVANYYFVREFCYGGMFRFNASGAFNVPYGGNAYNKKDFGAKVNNLFSDKVGRLMNRTTIENKDFEVFLTKHKPTGKDFVFFDPPYDTEFSGYEENPFERKDQERLANVILRLKAKFILIIKETPFIMSLYEHKGFKIEPFDKTYMFNIKGRHDREVRHLIIHNLTEKQSKLS